MEQKEKIQPIHQTKENFNPKTVNFEKIDIRNVPSFDENSRTAEVFDEITSDGKVTREEFGQMLKAHSQIIRDFLVAQETVARMEKDPNTSPAELDAARFMLQWLMIERDKSYQYTYQAFFYNQLSKEEIKKREMRRQIGEHIKLDVNPYLIFGMDGSAHKIFDYAREKEQKIMMTPEELKKTQQKIQKKLEELVEVKSPTERDLMLQRFLQEERQRVG